MAYFALVEDGKVKKLHVVADAALLNEAGETDEALGQTLLQSLHGIPAESWVQFSLEGEFRGSSIGLDFDWDPERDAFIPPQPYPSWSLNEQTFVWEAPIPYPGDDTTFFVWNEGDSSWVEVEF
jgi:hypothetical protein